MIRLEILQFGGKIKVKILVVIISFIIVLPIISMSSSYSYLAYQDSPNLLDYGMYPSLPIDTLTPDSDLCMDECSSVIVTGNASKDGRAILMKNRDWPLERSNRPIYVPSTSSTYAYVGVNTNTMGINERGLAVMNTAMPELESEPGFGNLLLNQKILEGYESVFDVAIALNDSRSLIGPTYRSSSGTVATCLGVIDRFGIGAFFEVSNTEAYVQYVVDGYETRANHARIFPGHASGPSGRDQYLLDILDAVYAKNGVISWEDIMQNASRYVRNKELGTTSFSIDGEVCNTGTVAAMVAVSGDSRYEGSLNIMWGAYGPTPLVSVFVPSMVIAGETPDSVASLWSYTSKKYVSAQFQDDPILLDPYRVREIQNFSFFAEEYTLAEYDRLMSSVPSGLTSYQLRTTLSEYILRADNYAAEVFIKETKDIEFPESVDFPIPTTQTTATTAITTMPSTTTTSTTPSTPSDSLTTSTTGTPTTSQGTTTPRGNYLGFTLVASVSVICAFSVVIIIILLKRSKSHL